MRVPAIAVVYADEAVRSSVRFLLELQGWAIHTFRTPSDFINNVDVDTIDCLVFDYCYPAGTGPDLLAELRAGGLVQPVIITATHIDAQGMRRAVLLDAHIVDALDGTALIDAIKTLLASDDRRAIR